MATTKKEERLEVDQLEVEQQAPDRQDSEDQRAKSIAKTNTPVEGNSTELSAYPKVIGALKSPLSVFGLAMLICNGVFSIAAAILGSLEAFIYSIHTFLAIVFAFIVIALWVPRVLYHPSELVGLEKELSEQKHGRLVVTAMIFISGVIYTGYQVYKLDQEHLSHRTHLSDAISKPAIPQSTNAQLPDNG